MHDRTLMCKFISAWPPKLDLAAWIKAKWHPQVHFDFHIGAKVFLTMIFTNLEDRS